MSTDLQLLVLAIYAAIYPTLLAVVVILLAQPRPVRLLATYLAGGLLTSVTIGLLIISALEGSKIVEGGERSGTSWRADVVIGGFALLAAVALSQRADQRWRERRKRRRAAAAKLPSEPKEKREPWSQRVLARGSVPIVFLAALAINVPGAAYLVALKDVAAGSHPTAVDVLLVLAFNAIMFLLAEIPLLGLLFAPERTGALVKRLNEWMARNSRQIAVGICLLFGAFLVVRGILNS